MLKLCSLTKVKVFFVVLVYVFNCDLSEVSAAILEKGLLQFLVSLSLHALLPISDKFLNLFSKACSWC